MQTDTLKKLSLEIALSEEQRQEAIHLLQLHNLPVTDIDETKLLYLLLAGSTVIGTAGLEKFDDCGLLRSVSVVYAAKGKGYGRFITETTEQYAAENGINCMYLLTTTAEQFFSKLGYSAVNRQDVPESIQLSTEFASVCQSTAVVMKKKI